MEEKIYTDFLPGRTLQTADKEYLYFSGTSYLGMACNQEFETYLNEGIKKYGTNYSSSRLSNVQLSVFEETEAYLCQYTGAQAALTLSSGFLAGQLVAQSLPADTVFLYGPLTHPALWRSAADFTNADFDQWAGRVALLIQESTASQIVLLFNSLDPLWVKKYNLEWMKQLPVDKNITVVIDDSHGFGITGRNGAGVYSEIALPPLVRLIVVSSMGKAMGIPAGLILSDTETISNLKRSSFYGGGSPAIPAYLYAFSQATAIYEKARERLLANILYFRSRLAKSDLFQSFPDYPVYFTPDNNLYSYLLKKNILISSFPYPTPTANHITRIVLNSLHTHQDLDQLVYYINQYYP